MAATAQATPHQYYGGTPHPVPQVNVMHNENARRNQLNRLKTIASLQIVGGTILVCFGIVAIVIMAFWSYFAIPIWSGIMFFVVTGGVGLRGAVTGKRSWIGTHIALSVISCLMGFALLETFIWAAILEYSDGIFYTCQPAGDNYIVINCFTSDAIRITFDALISATGFILFIVCIVAASFGCCAACTCCQMCCGNGCCGECGNCCCPPPPPTTAVFISNANGMQQGGTAYPNQPNYYVVQSNNMAIPIPPGTAYPPTAAAGRQTPPPGYPGYNPAQAQPPAGVQPSYQGSDPVTDKKG